MSGTASIAVGILMIFYSELDILLEDVSLTMKKITRKKEEYYADS